MPKLSVTIITLNEAAHVGAALDSVAWADEVIVVDAGSDDGTPDIARSRGARVIVRDWPGYVEQKNYAASLAANDWILSLDADERIPPPLADEIRGILQANPAAGAYRIPRVAFHLGRWIRTTDFYPDYQTRLYDRRVARWQGQHVHESVKGDRPPGQLRNEIEHYSFSDLRDQVDRLNHYSSLAARQMHENGRRSGPLHLLVQPPAAFLRNYILRRGFLDGTAGLLISLVNSYGVFLKFAKLWELERNPKAHVPSPKPHAPGAASQAPGPTR
ncbi:MAG: glycosyltransferase family 2 protein [Vicinamibacterales bacterium]